MSVISLDTNKHILSEADSYCLNNFMNHKYRTFFLKEPISFKYDLCDKKGNIIALSLGVSQKYGMLIIPKNLTNFYEDDEMLEYRDFFLEHLTKETFPSDFLKNLNVTYEDIAAEWGKNTLCCYNLMKRNYPDLKNWLDTFDRTKCNITKNYFHKDSILTHIYALAYTKVSYIYIVGISEFFEKQNPNNFFDENEIIKFMDDYKDQSKSKKK